MNDLPRIPRRQGPKPSTTNFPPHEQLDQNSSAAMQAALWQRMQMLPGTQPIASHIGPAGTRGLWLTTPQKAPDGAFMVGREFAHMHPAHDGSLHLALPHPVFTAAVAAGWAEAHPVAPVGKQGRIALIYGPRDEEELEVVCQLIEISHRFASQAPLDPSTTTQPR